MFPIPWYVALFESVPENILLIILGFKLFNIDVSLKQTVVIACVAASVSYYLRLEMVPFGIHTLIGIALLTLMSSLLFRLDFTHCLVSVLTGFLILGVFSIVLVAGWQEITSTSVDDLSKKPWLCIAYFVPVGVIMVTIYHYVRKYSLVVFDLTLTRDS
ncbi:MAG: hypothetical protein ACM3UZ_00250 [Acidobacteriota bacterium]